MKDIKEPGGIDFLDSCHVVATLFQCKVDIITFEGVGQQPEVFLRSKASLFDYAFSSLLIYKAPIFIVITNGIGIAGALESAANSRAQNFGAVAGGGIGTVDWVTSVAGIGDACSTMGSKALKCRGRFTFSTELFRDAVCTTSKAEDGCPCLR